MGLLSRYLKAEVPTLNKNNIRLEYIGRSTSCRPTCRSAWNGARGATSRNTGMVLTLALNYSSRSELVDAFRSMLHAAAQNGGVDHLHIDEDLVSQHLHPAYLRRRQGRQNRGAGQQGVSGRGRRSHHRRGAPPGQAAAAHRQRAQCRPSMHARRVSRRGRNAFG